MKPIFKVPHEVVARAEVERRTVNEFPTSDIRPVIWSGVGEVMDDMTKAGMSSDLVEVGGDFVSHAEDPGDAELIVRPLSVIDSPEQRDFYDRYQRQDADAEKCCQVFIVPRLGVDDAERDALEKAMRQLRSGISCGGKLGVAATFPKS